MNHDQKLPDKKEPDNKTESKKKFSWFEDLDIPLTQEEIMEDLLYPCQKHLS